MIKTPQPSPGDRYFKLRLAERGYLPPSKLPYWLCFCDCGKVKLILERSIKAHVTKSCGCLQREKARTLKPMYRHGLSKSQTWNSWISMRSRCYNKKNNRYNKYGARGIKVCERWLSFDNFYEDMGECPPGKSLDRIHNDKGYCKENCRWSTNKEQANNRSSNHKISYKNKLMTLMQISELLGLEYKSLHYFFKYRKLSIYECVRKARKINWADGK